MNDIRKYINVLKEAEEEQALLNEALRNVDEDVNFIYDIFFKKYIDVINQSGNVNVIRSFTPLEIDTGLLPSEESKKAHKLNPCKITINNTDSTNQNYYNPNKSVIGLSLPIGAFKYIKDEWGGNINDAATAYPTIKYEFTEYRVKGSINHELTHWLDDTFNNNNIKRKLDSYLKGNNGYSSGENKTHMIYYEVNAMMGNIMQAYNKYKDTTWDTMTFNDLVNILPSLHNAKNVMIGKELKDYYIKIKTRMYREGILGKNMR